LVKFKKVIFARLIKRAFYFKNSYRQLPFLAKEKGDTIYQECLKIVWSPKPTTPRLEKNNRIR
jgi:hypothetical protein